MTERYHPQTEKERTSFLAGEIAALVQFHVQGFNPDAMEAKYVYPFRDYEYELKLSHEVLPRESLQPSRISKVTITRTTSFPDLNDGNPYEDQEVTFVIGKNLLLKTATAHLYGSGSTDYFTPGWQTLQDKFTDDFDIGYHPPMEIREQELADLKAELLNPGRDTQFLKRIIFP